jgi:hypothetical protein
MVETATTTAAPIKFLADLAPFLSTATSQLFGPSTSYAILAPTTTAIGALRSPTLAAVSGRNHAPNVAVWSLSP